VLESGFVVCSVYIEAQSLNIVRIQHFSMTHPVLSTFIIATAFLALLSANAPAQRPVRMNPMSGFGDGAPLVFTRDVARMFAWWSVEADAGASIFHISGDVAGLFSFFPYCQCMQFVTPTSAVGFHSAVRGTKRLGPSITVALAMEYLRYGVRYEERSSPLPYIDANTGSVRTFQREYTASLAFDEFAVEPSVRIDILGVPAYLEAGASVATIFSHAASAHYGLTNGVQFPDGATSYDSSTTDVGRPELQLSAFTGVGYSMVLGHNVLVTAAVRARVGLTSLFKNWAESPAKIDYAIEPTVGIGWVFL
jgi:hypothetical protein